MCLLKTEDIESGRYAAFALSNLAANANHRQQIVDEGGAAALVALACCEDLNAQPGHERLARVMYHAPL